MASKSNKSRPIDPAELSYEQAVEEIEAITARIEAGEVGLEESLTQLKRGNALVQRCRTLLDAAEQQVLHVQVPTGPGEPDESNEDAR